MWIDQHLLVRFAVTTLVAMITPGPDMPFVLGCGMRGGPPAGLLVLFDLLDELLEVGDLVAQGGLTGAVPT